MNYGGGGGRANKSSKTLPLTFNKLMGLPLFV